MKYLKLFENHSSCPVCINYPDNLANSDPLCDFHYRYYLYDPVKIDKLEDCVFQIMDKNNCHEKTRNEISQLFCDYEFGWFVYTGKVSIVNIPKNKYEIIKEELLKEQPIIEKRIENKIKFEYIDRTNQPNYRNRSHIIISISE